MDEVFDLIDAPAKRFPMKALAPRLGKAESTLRNELNQQEGYKLGLRTFVMATMMIQDFAALDRIEEMCGRIAHKLPEPKDCDMASLVRLFGEHATEYGEAAREFGKGICDGVIKKDEAARWLRELIEVNQKGLYLQACIKKYLRRWG